MKTALVRERQPEPSDTALGLDNSPDGSKATVSGVLVAVFYHNDGFMIGKIASGLVVKGSMAKPEVGLTYTFHGAWVTHPRYGKQLAFDSYASALPTSPEAIRAYIDRAKWVGPAIARALVECYGDKTLDVLKNSPDEVAARISGITPERAQKIAADLKQNEEFEAAEINLRDALRGVQISKRAFQAILRRYGSDGSAILASDPYRMAREIDGVSFHIADTIAARAGLAADSPKRIEAGIRHVLLEAASADGHTFMPKTELVSEAKSLLDVKRAQIDAVLTSITSDGDSDVDSDIVLNDAKNEVALAALRRDEEYVAAKLIALNQSPDPVDVGDLTGLAQDQIEAVEMSVKHGVFVVYGSPGVGKSTLITKLVENFQDTSVALCAPSGKAARRISELTRHHATTIHVLLEARPTKDGGFFFARNEENPIDATLVVADEMSMCDVQLMAALLRALRSGTRLFLIGDPYQLPSVGPGNVLRDIIESNVIPAKELTIIKRQQPGLIIKSCAAIKDGFDIVETPETPSERDLNFIEAETQEECQQEIVDVVSAYTNLLDDPLREMQVLTALREKSDLSVKALNAVLRETLNAENKPRDEDASKFDFWIGDKIIQRKNDYQLGIMNGDIGFVEEIDEKGSTLTVSFDDPPRVVAVPMRDNRLELAYAITTHSFQGSQAQIVIVAVHSCLGAVVPTRPWIYTSLSRARKLCVLVGERDALTRMIQRNRAASRWTNLKQLLERFDSETELDAEPEPEVVVEPNEPDEPDEPEELTNV